jgi:hypothetical protein
MVRVAEAFPVVRVIASESAAPVPDADLETGLAAEEEVRVGNEKLVDLKLRSLAGDAGVNFKEGDERRCDDYGEREPHRELFIAQMEQLVKKRRAE